MTARRASGERRYGMVLLSLVAVYAVIVAFNGDPLGNPIIVLGTAAALLMVARNRPRHQLRIAVGAVVPALIAGALASAVHATRLGVALTAGATLVLVAAATTMMGAALWRRAKADAQTVAGALAVYLLLALFFAMLHQLSAAVLGGRYADGVSGASDTAGLLYFSVITLTTVGFGDVTPACAAARAVTLTEALVGQLYLVAIVGAVVGNWGRPVRRAPHGDAAPPGGT